MTCRSTSFVGSRQEVRTPGGAGQRRLKLDIEQSWDPEGAARWGDDFPNSVKSIWIPMRSELSDTFNRYFWLHKTAFSLSQIRMVELDEETTINEVTDEGLATVDMVTEYTKEYTARMSTSIMRFLLTFEDDYGDDLSTLIDERRPRRRWREPHEDCSWNTIRLRQGHQGAEDNPALITKFHSHNLRDVLAAALTEDGSLLPATSAKVRTTMKPYVDVVA
ncbi:hypothetical protein V1520DRAFT_392826 [Lipomyces starkeyi]|uniref:Uncharacterized protein n=1 Tax=Lipomyces starkeyi NRRL Y-11557 TaxID=675824 RepID=A0A1E3Q1X4_LIPST|nr:hypothetical protein LIPSTDRAFT_112592 [Lipomyces starkeyi NRRL Y-11557]